MGSGIALLLWTAKLPSPFLFLYHRYVSILKYNTAGVCLAIKKAMPVNGHRLFDHERTRCNGDHEKIGSPYRQPSPRGKGAPNGRIGHCRYERAWENAFQAGDLWQQPNAVPAPWSRRPRETLIQSLSDFTLKFLCIARNNLTRIASYLRKVMTKLWIKILVKSDSAIESAFP